jgi:hypothetical protein
MCIFVSLLYHYCITCNKTSHACNLFASCSIILTIWQLLQVWHWQIRTCSAQSMHYSHRGNQTDQTDCITKPNNAIDIKQRFLIIMYICGEYIVNAVKWRFCLICVRRSVSLLLFAQSMHYSHRGHQTDQTWNSSTKSRSKNIKISPTTP